MTKIEWVKGADGSAGETWNPVVGCSIVSPGCTNCYAMKWAYARMDRPHNQFPHYRGTTAPSKSGGVWTGKVAMAPEHILRKPLAWRRPRRIFVNSMGDLFHEDVPDEWIDRVFAVMALTPQHDYQVLTKRSGRMLAYMSARQAACVDAGPFVAPDRITVAAQKMCINADGTISREMYGTRQAIGIANQFGSIRWPLPNVWLGVSAEDQRRADERIPDLLATPAAVRFVSAEPLLGPIDFTRIEAAATGTLIKGDFSYPKRINALTGAAGHYSGKGIFAPNSHQLHRLDQIIVGGESGPGARPMHPAWARSIRDQCQAAGVPFFFKQWGEFAYTDPVNAIDKAHIVCIDNDGHDAALSKTDRGWHRMGHRDQAWSTVAGPPANWMQLTRVGKSRAGRLLDGRTWDEMPSTTPTIDSAGLEPL